MSRQGVLQLRLSGSNNNLTIAIPEYVANSEAVLRQILVALFVFALGERMRREVGQPGAAATIRTAFRIRYSTFFRIGIRWILDPKQALILKGYQVRVRSTWHRRYNRKGI